jgi:hypothetical protein
MDDMTKNDDLQKSDMVGGGMSDQSSVVPDIGRDYPGISQAVPPDISLPGHTLDQAGSSNTPAVPAPPTPPAEETNQVSFENKIPSYDPPHDPMDALDPHPDASQRAV